MLLILLLENGRHSLVVLLWEVIVLFWPEAGKWHLPI
jgi:hypothetical protein